MKSINLVMINKYHGYSVWTFEDMMQCMLHALQSAGYTAHISANVIDPQGINILFGVGSTFSHSYEEIQSFASPSNTIVFNGEQVESSSKLITDEYLEFLSKYIVFDWCEANIAAIKSRVVRHHPLFEFPIFPTANLCGFGNVGWHIEYDLGFYGAMLPRRKVILDELDAAGIRVKQIHKAYGSALVDQILDCRYVLNTHAYETDLLEINRCLRPLSMGIPVISEQSTLPASGDWDHSGIIFCPRQGFAEHVKAVLATPDAHLVAARKAVQFTHRGDNVSRTRQVMDAALGALGQLAA